MGKKIVASLLMTCFLVMSAAPPAHAAQAPRLQKVLTGLKNHSRFTRFNVRPVSARDADSKLAEAAKAKAKQTGGVLFETFLFITTLAVIDVAAREVKKQGLSSLTPQYLGAITLKAAHAVVDMPEVYAGLAGATVTLAGAKVPTAAMQMIFKTPSIKKAFVPVLARAAAASIMFVGWEMGSQLWTEASLLLSEEDHKIAISFLGMSSGVAKTAVAAGSANDRARARVAKLMMQNMVRVLFLNSDLRSQWMNNTWRLHVMTGDFAALLGAMMVAGEVGARYGKLRGFFTGVVLGALTLAIPKKPKDAVTNTFQSVRARVIEARLRENSQTLSGQALTGPKFASILANRRSYRESLATISWERAHRAVANKDSSALVEELSTFSEIYSNDRSELARLRASVTPARRRLVEIELAKVEAVMEFASLLREGGAELASDVDFRQITDANNSRGFSEAPVIEQVRAE